MKMIPLTQGKVALVDDEDFDRVNQFKWCAHTDGYNWYAERGTGSTNGKQGHIKLHQFLLPGHPRVDHKNGDGLDNQRHNLRPATHGQNVANSSKKQGAYKSQYKGVSQEGAKWRARIRVSGKCYSLGLCELEQDAGKAYDAAAKEFFGEFANLNFP